MVALCRGQFNGSQIGRLRARAQSDREPAAAHAHNILRAWDTKFHLAKGKASLFIVVASTISQNN